MSAYSGKCDVADWFEDKDDDYIKNSEFYLFGEIVPLRINNQHDLAPYYPYIIIIGGGKDTRSIVHFSKESFIDSEEKDHLGWRLQNIQKYYRKCKRNKIPYTVEEAVKQCCFFTSTDVDKRIAEVVGEHGNKVTVEDLIEEYKIRLSTSEYYRERLLERMIELGWDKSKAEFWIWKSNERRERIK